MCNIKNSPIKPKFITISPAIADHCLVETINYLNEDPELATFASCCGHKEEGSYPYITIVQPHGRIKEIKNYLQNKLNWNEIEIVVFGDKPWYKAKGLSRFLVDKVYVGYYSLDNVGCVKTFAAEECWGDKQWSEDDI